MKGFIFAFFIIPAIAMATPVIYEKQYSGFTVWLDCTEQGAVAFKYELGSDNANLSRDGTSFVVDPSVPQECQPTNGDSYRTDNVDVSRTGTYDRGHLIPANHLDNNLISFNDSFYVTNILPQQSTFNQRSGAWYRTEMISECYRDITPLTIWGGVIWGDDASDDFFTESHGVKTPDKWWKLIYRHDNNDFIAWVFPNTRSSKASVIDKHIVTINELKAQLKYSPDFGVIEQFPDSKPDESWELSGSSTLKCEGHTTGNH